MVVALAALGGAFLWLIGPVANLLTDFFFGVIGTVTYAIFGRDVNPSTQNTTKWHLSSCNNIPFFASEMDIFLVLCSHNLNFSLPGEVNRNLSSI